MGEAFTAGCGLSVHRSHAGHLKNSRSHPVQTRDTPRQRDFALTVPFLSLEMRHVLRDKKARNVGATSDDAPTWKVNLCCTPGRKRDPTKNIKVPHGNIAVGTAQVSVEEKPQTLVLHSERT